MSDEPKPPVKIEMTRDEVRAIVHQAVDETLVKLGLEPNQVGDMQRDFIFLRTLRTTHETVKSKALWVLLGTIATVTLTLLTLGLKFWLVQATTKS